MSENDEQPQRGSGAWWLLWILSTVILPAVAGAVVFQNSKHTSFLAVVLCCISFGLNLGASGKLDPKTGCLAFVLIFGGWPLMVAAFFLGCASIGIPHH